MDDRLIGDALLSNTTACEASRLLISPINEGLEFRLEAARRASDLMSLIDSAVLHERIFYLPASLPKDVGELELRNRLVEISALAPLQKGGDHDAIGQAILASLSTVEGFREIETTQNGPDWGAPLSFEKLRPRLMEMLGLTTGKDHVVRERPVEFDNGHDTLLAVPAEESFDAAARNLIGWMHYRGSGVYGHDSMASLRAMYYVFASEHYGLPYLASASIQAVQQRFPNYLQPSVREQLYQRLGSALQATVETIAQEFNGAIVFVPPFSALVLDRASTPAGIPSEVLALREEYSNFRSKMMELERDHFEAKSLKDRKKIIHQIEQLGKEVARPFDQPSQMKLEPALRYIPDAVGVVANPTNPVGWAQMLLDMPTKALVSWYRRRPVAKLVRTAKAVSALPDYDGLLTKHFGQAVASATLEIQSRLQET